LKMLKKINKGGKMRGMPRGMMPF